MGKKVLVVDDVSYIRFLIRKYFDKIGGFDVTDIELGNDAMQSLRTNKYDLLLLDLNLPDMDGRQIMDEMKKEKINVPIIIISATSNTLSSDYEVLACLSKPIDFKTLEAEISKVFP